MNIFVLDLDVTKCAAAHCDRHVIKMIVETAQLLSTAHHVLDGSDTITATQVYRPTHKNHPCAVWARQNVQNYHWLAALGVALCEEYTRRYKKVHASERILKLLIWHPRNIPVGDFVMPPQCMPDQYKGDDVVQAYRHYYAAEKWFAKWSHGPKPTWWEEQAMIFQCELDWDDREKIVKLDYEVYEQLELRYSAIFYNPEFMADVEDIEFLNSIGLKPKIVKIRGMAYKPLEAAGRELVTPGITHQSINVSVANVGLFAVNKVEVMEDCCTDKLQEYLDRGWRIVAVCPPNDARRPTYVLGSIQTPSGEIKQYHI